MGKHLMEPPRSAAETRCRRRIRAAIDTLVGQELADELYEHLPDVGGDAPPEGLVAKLRQLKTCEADRAWLRSQPGASWPAVARVRLRRDRRRGRNGDGAARQRHHARRARPE